MLGPLLRVEMSKKCTSLLREAHFEVKTYKTHHSRTTFGSCDVEKVHAVMREAHLQVKKLKSTAFGALLEVELSKKCTPLWREAHFEVKMYKTAGIRTTFGRSDVVSRGRRKGLCTLPKVSAKREGFVAVYNYNRHYTTLHSTTTTTTPRLHSTTLQLHYATLNSTTLHYTTPLHTTLHYTTLHCITLRYTTIRYTTLHCTLHYANYIHNYNYIYSYNTLQNTTATLQLQLRYTNCITLH